MLERTHRLITPLDRKRQIIGSAISLLFIGVAASYVRAAQAEPSYYPQISSPTPTATPNIDASPSNEIKIKSVIAKPINALKNPDNPKTPIPTPTNTPRPTSEALTETPTPATPEPTPIPALRVSVSINNYCQDASHEFLALNTRSGDAWDIYMHIQTTEGAQRGVNYLFYTGDDGLLITGSWGINSNQLPKTLEASSTYQQLDGIIIEDYLQTTCPQISIEHSPNPLGNDIRAGDVVTATAEEANATNFTWSLTGLPTQETSINQTTLKIPKDYPLTADGDVISTLTVTASNKSGNPPAVNYELIPIKPKLQELFLPIVGK